MQNKKVKTKFVTSGEAVRVISSGDNIYVHANCSYPKTLIDALCNKHSELYNVKIIHLMSFLDAPYVSPEMEGHFRLCSLFTGANVRRAVNEGRADFIQFFFRKFLCSYKATDFLLMYVCCTYLLLMYMVIVPLA